MIAGVVGVVSYKLRNIIVVSLLLKQIDILIKKYRLKIWPYQNIAQCLMHFPKMLAYVSCTKQGVSNSLNFDGFAFLLVT